jgi:hypothetical protein
MQTNFVTANFYNFEAGHMHHSVTHSMVMISNQHIHGSFNNHTVKSLRKGNEKTMNFVQCVYILQILKVAFGELVGTQANIIHPLPKRESCKVQ